MSLRVDLHAEALDELEDAAAWYESRGAGLGLEFTAEIERVIASIASARWRSRSGCWRIPHAARWPPFPIRGLLKPPTGNKKNQEGR